MRSRCGERRAERSGGCVIELVTLAVLVLLLVMATKVAGGDPF